MHDLLKKRVLIIDGAMGTMVQEYKLSEEAFRGDRFSQSEKLLKGNNDLLCLTKPEVVKEIHHKYLAAGADIIETNTFNAQRISMSDYAMEDICYEINFEAAKIARQCCDEVTKAEQRLNKG